MKSSALFVILFAVLAICQERHPEGFADHETQEKPRRVEKQTIEKPETCTQRAHFGDKVEVHYDGYLESNGNKFDSSRDRGEPFKFVLGNHEVIRGWEEGINGMCVGEKRKLTIPPRFGYGEKAVGSIPANSILIFDVELIQIDLDHRKQPHIPPRHTPGVYERDIDQIKRPDRPERPERPPRPDRPDFHGRNDKHERPPRPDRPKVEI
ncbi:MAG: putative FK506-binding protein 2 [Streblomastix strix]|uniref:peptidylprolyl isomerase n=1 Tax=Streblomastix strix TaxID=222440 RepID=A0A5J4W517_9EUKA|nr:MAG: putative FK506-binding protein 2 [Streblomastix strix]